MQIEKLPKHIKTIKLEVRTWDSLKSMKKENETFDDIIKGLLKQRTQHVGDKNIKAIRYQRKTAFFTYRNLGIEFEYNDIKSNKDDFTIDVKIKKVFSGKKTFNPSEFFGVDNEHKHYSNLFLLIYLKAVNLVLSKEFRVQITEYNIKLYEDVALWRQLYYEYSLSEESFKEDIERPLRLSEDERPSERWKKRIKDSFASKEIIQQ